MNLPDLNLDSPLPPPPKVEVPNSHTEPATDKSLRAVALGDRSGKQFLPIRRRCLTIPPITRLV